MSYEGPFVLGILLIIIGLVLGATGRLTRPKEDLANRPRQRRFFRRYVAFEGEENQLLVPILLVLGAAGIVIGGLGLLLT